MSKLSGHDQEAQCAAMPEVRRVVLWSQTCHEQSEDIEEGPSRVGLVQEGRATGETIMTWGNFQFQHCIHVAPCTVLGFVLPGHILSPLCDCQPTPQTRSDWARAIWTHHDNH